MVNVAEWKNFASEPGIPEYPILWENPHILTYLPTFSHIQLFIGKYQKIVKFFPIGQKNR
jgi:hypothetical protein